jgi:hypothetical protein
MDALDEFFGTWAEPEAWCEVCDERPAIHIVLRDTAGMYDSVMSHVRVWNPDTQTRVPVCRQCCRQHLDGLHQRRLPQGGGMRQAQHFVSTPVHAEVPLQAWMSRLVERSKAFVARYFEGWRR